MNSFQNGLSSLGYVDAKVGIQGSSLTGWSIAKNLPFRASSDLDLAVSSSSLLQDGKNLVSTGPKILKSILRGAGTRFGPIGAFTDPAAAQMEFDALDMTAAAAKNQMRTLVAADIAMHELNLTNILADTSESVGGRAVSIMNYASVAQAESYAATAWNPQPLGLLQRFQLSTYRGIGAVSPYVGPTLQFTGVGLGMAQTVLSDDPAATGIYQLSSIGLGNAATFSAIGSGTGFLGTVAAGVTGSGAGAVVGEGAVVYAAKARNVAQNVEARMRSDLGMFTTSQLRNLAASRDPDGYGAIIKTYVGGTENTREYRNYTAWRQRIANGSNEPLPQSLQRIVNEASGTGGR